MNCSYDAGVLIGLERRDRTYWSLHRKLLVEHGRPYVSAATLAEVWRGTPGHGGALRSALSTCTVEPVDEAVALAAGAALAAVPVGTVDAIVAATTARRGGTLYTTDPADHLRLAEHFRTLKVCAVPAAG